MLERKNASPSVLAVLVLYRRSLTESSTFQSLCQAKESGIKDLRVYIFDNSPEELHLDDRSFVEKNSDWISYSHFPENISLAKIYNLGIQARTNEDSMLILDQDSFFQPDFFHSFFTAEALHPDVDLFLPLVKHNEIIVSPGKWNGFKGNYLDSVRGGRMSAKGMTAIASGMFVRYRFLLNEFCGFDERFKLYGIDTYIMQQLANSGKDFFLLPFQLGHELAEYSIEPVEKKIFRFEEFVWGSLLLTEESRINRLKCTVFLFYKAIRHSWFYRNTGFLKCLLSFPDSGNKSVGQDSEN